MIKATDRPFKLPRPNQLKELTPDQIVAVVLRLAMEVSVLRDRISTHEALLSEHGLLASEDVDRFEPTGEEAKERMRARTELIDSIIKDLSDG